jgi:hypothetical protein
VTSEEVRQGKKFKLKKVARRNFNYSRKEWSSSEVETGKDEASCASANPVERN